MSPKQGSKRFNSIYTVVRRQSTLPIWLFFYGWNPPCLELQLAPPGEEAGEGAGHLWQRLEGAEEEAEPLSMLLVQVGAEGEVGEEGALAESWG